MAEDVKLKIGADTSDLEKAFGNLIKKIQSDADKLKLSPTAATSKGSAVQTVRDQERVLTRETALLNSYNKSLESRKKILEDILKLEAKGVDITKDKARAEARLDDARRIAAIQSANVKKLEESAARTMGISEGGAGRGFGGLKGFGLSAVVGGTAAMVVNKVLEVARETIKSPMTTAQMQGSAIAGTTGQTLSQMQSGQFVYESMFGAERTRAGSMAQTAQNQNKVVDALEIIGTLGTSLLFSEKQRALIFNPEKYGAMQAQEFAQNRNATLEGLKAQDPFKRDAMERLQGNAPAYIGMQRALGLSDPELFNYLRSSVGAGFTDQQGMQATSAIMGAGGSTSMGRNSVMALQAQRGLNLNNATGIFGALSGSMGSAETSKNTLIDIFSTAQAIGLDKSKFAAENSKFIQTVAEVVNQASLTSKAGAAQVTDQMSSFAQDATTMRGLENSRAAFEAYRGATTATSGFSGAINTAVIMRQFPDLLRAAGNDPRALQVLLRNKDMLDPNSTTFQSALLNVNSGIPQNRQLTQQQLLNQFRSSGIQSIKAQLQDQGSIVTDMAKEMQNFVGPGKFEMSPQLKKRLLMAEGQLARIPGYEGLKTPQLEQSLLGFGAEAAKLGATPEVQAKIDKYKEGLEKETTKQFEEKDTGRALDKIIAASAEEAGISLKTLSGILDELAGSAQRASGASTAHSDELKKMYDTYNKMKSQGDARAESYRTQYLEPAQRNYETGHPLNEGVSPYSGNPRANPYGYRQPQSAPGR